jgi:TonB family protein
MNSSQLWAICALVSLQTCPVQAQDADAPARAQRDADNPLRMIIEASKLKPRQKTTEAEPVVKQPAEKAAARQVAVKPAASIAPQAPVAVPGERGQALALNGESAPAKLALPALADEPVPNPTLAEPQGAGSASPSAVTGPAPSPLQVEPAAAPSYDPDNYFGAPPPGTAVAALPATRASAIPLARPAPAPSAGASAAKPLQLADYVEPVLPDRVRRRLQVDGDVVVNFTVNPDGSVVDASVRSSNDRALDAVALEAVRQWRYQPIPVAQAHAVQLVFRLRE